jgi:hypothetical protein
VTDALRNVLTVWGNPPSTLVDKLPKPTKRDNEKGSCRECGGWHGLPAVHLDYMGHASVTRALIEIDPEWSWEPIAFNDAGEPVVTLAGSHLRMWGRLTLLGKTLICVGTCDANKPEPEKELIGDLLRNGAMRFGIGLALWAKDEWNDLRPVEPLTPFDAVAPAIQMLDEKQRGELKDWAHENGITVTRAALTDEQADALRKWLERPFEEPSDA